MKRPFEPKQANLAGPDPFGRAQRNPRVRPAGRVLKPTPGQRVKDAAGRFVADVAAEATTKGRRGAVKAGGAAVRSGRHVLDGVIDKVAWDHTGTRFEDRRTR
jgi:hypothetical protein